MGPTWVLSAPDGPHAGPMNLAIRVLIQWLDKEATSPERLGMTPIVFELIFFKYLNICPLMHKYWICQKYSLPGC